MWLTKVVPSILRVQWVHIRTLSLDSDASGFVFGVSEGARIPYVTVNNVIFLFFAILTMFWCFPGLGVADKSCSEHIAGTLGAHSENT